MSSHLTFRRDADELSRTVQRNSVKVLLRSIPWRCVKIVPCLFLVDDRAVDNVVIALRKQCQFLSLARVAISVPPTVSFADNDKFFATLDPNES